MSRLFLPLLSLGSVAALAGTALAQPTPKFEYGKAADVKDVKDTVWSATAEASVVLATGNSRTTTVSGGLKAMRKQAANKLSIEASGTYARASTLTIVNDPGTPPTTVSESELRRTSTDSAKNYAAKLRYDRFLTEFNSLFVAALAGADPLAGKDFVGGGQLGYARLIYKTEQHETTGEFGYDFSYENYAIEDAAATQSIQIHSARAFLGHKAKLSEDTSFDGSIEILDNLNANASSERFDDLRVNVATALSTKLTKGVAFSFSFAAKYDNVPAPLGLTLPEGQTLDPTNPPTSSKIDTITKASLIITLL